MNKSYTMQTNNVISRLYRILAVINAALINRSLAKIGGMLIPDFENQFRLKQGDAQIIEGALMTARLR